MFFNKKAQYSKMTKKHIFWTSANIWVILKSHTCNWSSYILYTDLLTLVWLS